MLTEFTDSSSTGLSESAGSNLPAIQAGTQQRFNEDHARRFLSYIIDPLTGCAELRIFKAKKANRGNWIEAADQYAATLGGWYDRIETLIIDLQRIRGVSAYLTLNPVSRDLLCRIDHEVKKIDRGSGTNDTQIVCLRWMYLDFDPRRATDISATDEERQRAIAKRDKFLADHPEIAACAIWGCSGNGCWIFVRLPDYPNDEFHNAYVKSAIDSISHFYSDAAVEIDRKTCNPSRVSGIPGLVKCKGSNRPERPWRLATIDSPEGHQPTPLDLISWLASRPELPAVESANGEARPVATGSLDGPSRAVVVSSVPPWLDRRITAFMAAVPPAVSGQGGHDQTFSAATALVKGFGLTIEAARPYMDRYNLICQPPWDAQDIEHKLVDADSRPDDKPRGYLKDQGQGERWQEADIEAAIAEHEAARAARGSVDPAKLRRDIEEVTQDKDWAAFYASPSIIMDLARLEDANGGQYAAILAELERKKLGDEKLSKSLLNKAMKGPRDSIKRASSNRKPIVTPHMFNLTDMGNAKRLVFLQGDNIRYIPTRKVWMVWNKFRWVEDVSLLIEALAKTIAAQVRLEMPPRPDKDTLKMFADWAEYSESKNGIFNALTLARSEPGIPASMEDFDTDLYLFNVQNGTVDLRTGKLKAHNRSDLITKLSPVVHEEKAVSSRWDQFMREVFKNDACMIDYVHRVTGYAMSGLDVVQEMNILVGDGGNGKNVYSDTISYVMGEYAHQAEPEILLESKNDRHPTGIASLASRRFVAVSEVDMDKKFAEGTVKRLTGDRKITARFMHENFFSFYRQFKIFLSVNHKPKVKGLDDGIWRRMRVWNFDVKFVSPDDPGSPKVNGTNVFLKEQGLDKKLQAEASGILNRLIAGFLDWQKDGMRPPESVIVATQGYREENDPLNDWIESGCVLDASLVTPSADLYRDYLNHCSKRSITPISQTSFGRALTKRQIVDKPGKYARCRAGIGLGNPEVVEWLKEHLRIPRKVVTILSDAEAQKIPKDEVYRAKRTIGAEEILGYPSPTWSYPGTVITSTPVTGMDLEGIMPDFGNPNPAPY